MIAIITVYKEKEHLKGIIDELLNQNIKGIIVEVDKPNKELAKLIKSYEKILKNKKVKNEVKIYEINKKRKRIKIKIIKGRIKESKVIFIISKERRGKVNCLNEASKIAKDNKLLFLDNDVIIKFDIKEIDKLLNKYDFIDVKKEVNTKGKFLKELINFDYFANMALLNFIFSKSKKFFNANGACIAIRRDVLEKVNFFDKEYVEDAALSIKLSCNNYNLHYFFKEKVLTEAPSSFKSFIKQRKRWYWGGARVVVKKWKDLLKVFLKNKKMLKVLIIFLPSLSWLLSFYNFFIALSTFLFSTFVLYYYFSKKINYKLNFLYLPIFSLIFNNFIFALLFFQLFRVLLRRESKGEWKV